MENCHYQKFGLSNFGWSSKLHVFGKLDQNVVLHLPYNFGGG
jgi:hypothetical protein